LFWELALQGILQLLTCKNTWVLSPSSTYQWIPSNIWVGVGRMTADEIKFDFSPLYKKWGISTKSLYKFNLWM